MGSYLTLCLLHFFFPYLFVSDVLSSYFSGSLIGPEFSFSRILFLVAQQFLNMVCHQCCWTCCTTVSAPIGFMPSWWYLLLIRASWKWCFLEGDSTDRNLGHIKGVILKTNTTFNLRTLGRQYFDQPGAWRPRTTECWDEGHPLVPQLQCTSWVTLNKLFNLSVPIQSHL